MSSFLLPYVAFAQLQGRGNATREGLQPARDPVKVVFSLGCRWQSRKLAVVQMSEKEMKIDSPSSASPDGIYFPVDRLDGSADTQWVHNFYNCHKKRRRPLRT